MRVLFTTTGSAGHLGPLVPFADAVRRAGGDVLVATRGSSAKQAPRPASRYGRSPTRRRSSAPALAEVRDLPLDVAYPRLVADVFGGMDARAALQDVLDACAAWRPDVVVSEPSEFAGRSQPGISTFPRSPSRSRSSPSSTRCAGRWTMRCAGCTATTLFAGPNGAGSAHSTLMPTLLEDPGLPGPPGMAAVPRAGRAAARAAAGLVGRRERTAGLRHIGLGGAAARRRLPRGYRRVLEALGPLPVRVLATVGRDRDPADLGTRTGERPRRALGAPGET